MLDSGSARLDFYLTESGHFRRTEAHAGLHESAYDRVKPCREVLVGPILIIAAEHSWLSEWQLCSPETCAASEYAANPGAACSFQEQQQLFLAAPVKTGI